MRTIFVFFMMIAITAQGCKSDDTNTSPDPEPVGRFDNLPQDVILQWNETALDAMGGFTYLHSHYGAYVNVMMHLAMHNALNGIEPEFETYYFDLVDPEADPVVAASQAAYAVLSLLLPDAQPLIDTRLNEILSGIPESVSKSKGIHLGNMAGQAITSLRQNDNPGADPFGPIAPSTVPGVYQAVPPFDFVFGPTWASMATFGLESIDQFRSEPHPALNSEQYAIEFEEVKTIGRLNSEARTEAGTIAAAFWYEYSEIGWNRIARVAAMDRNLNLYDSARLFALLNMGLMDSYLAGWDSKFHYNLWRPYTAIHAAENDGNLWTEPDLTWESQHVNPPVQDYPSTHSALGNAGATILTYYFGDMAFSFASSTWDEMNTTRSFPNFMDAADENADSRVQAGIHFRSACEAGQTLGNDVGQWIVVNHLKPIQD